MSGVAEGATVAEADLLYFGGAAPAEEANAQADAQANAQAAPSAAATPATPATSTTPAAVLGRGFAALGGALKRGPLGGKGGGRDRQNSGDPRIIRPISDGGDGGGSPDKAGNPIGALANLAASLGDGIQYTTEQLGSNLATMASRKYTVPDKTVASQVLMYRQLLHTACKPGLRLSRPYEATAAQRAVVHMPWWEKGVLTTKKMCISYNNLIARLWLAGAILPFGDGDGDGDGESQGKGGAQTTEEDHRSAHSTDEGGAAKFKVADADVADDSGSGSGDVPRSRVDTLIGPSGLPPVPHPYWVDRLGFQQPDPVTDFRSGGVLSLAMLVHIVETCPHVHRRFLPPDGVARVLPFGITCINITDMMAKFLMFSRAVDRVDALLSHRPFWRMFADPNALLACQELSMDMLADVVVEMERERRLPDYVDPSGLPGAKGGDGTGSVSVFDFSEILDRTEKRVRDDLLGAGPKSVVELRSVHARLKVRYEKAMARREREASRRKAAAEGASKLLDKVVGGAVDSEAWAIGLPPPNSTSTTIAERAAADAAANGANPPDLHRWSSHAAEEEGGWTGGGSAIEEDDPELI